jgi:hypothetical protein
MSALNRAAFERLIVEDLSWLRGQPRTLERDHIEDLLCAAAHMYYDVGPAPLRLRVQPGVGIKPEGYIADEDGTLP